MTNVERTIQENIHNQRAIFVFPTDVAATSWAEFALTIDGVGAISSERFMAWDSFKSYSIRSQMQDKNSVPSVLRKFFAQNILLRNKTENLFTTIINRDYIETSSSFSDWLAGILPQLQIWEETLNKQATIDAEDNDFLRLKTEYENFLEANNLFDPAWERPPFHDDGCTYFICYPEILQDYAEYKEILETTNCIHIIPIDEVTEKQTVLQYTNTRSELRETAQFIKNLCETTNTQYNDIALSLKDLKTLEPYITREFDLYNIPYKLRSGKALSEYPAGKLFSLLNDCYTENFSFESIKNLVLDTTFPWADTVAASQLIDFGIKKNCLCSYDNKDIWEESFKKSNGEERAAKFYKKLKITIKDIVKSTSFEFILQHYMNFRETFFNQANFTEEADIILSRCIVELVNLVNLEKDFPEATNIEKPFTFFVEQLNNSQYVPQSSTVGVNIFTYKLASCALFKQHIIFDSSQDSLTIAEKRLAFLSDDKRKNLGIKDENTSKDFTNLYGLHSEHTAHFTCSEKTFAGFAIPFNGLEVEKRKTKLETKDSSETDLFFQEKQLFLQNTKDLPKIHSIQKESFDNWNPTENSTENNAQFAEIIRQKIFNGKPLLSISPTTLREFYDCPIKWLFSRLLQLEETTLEANLLDSMFIGTFYHEIIRRYLESLKKEKRALAVTEDGELPQDLKERLIAIAEEVIEGFPKSCEIRELSDLTMEMFRMQRENFIETILTFMTSFSSSFNGSTISDTERKFEIPYSDHIINGKIDCVLNFPGNNATPEGKFIVDFKSTTPPSRKQCLKTDENELEDFQLPFYIHLCETEWYNGMPNVQGAAFISIRSGEIIPLVGILGQGRKTNPYGKKARLTRTETNDEGISFEPTMEALYTAIEGFKSAILEEDLSIFTDRQKWGTFPNGEKVPFKKCVGCEYKKYCRTTYSISGAQ